MRKLFIPLLLACCMLPAALGAQELEVKSFGQPTIPDPAATQFPVKDSNDKTCALVIVGIAAEDVKFDGDVCKVERKANGQYWVYFMEGSTYMEISAPGCLPKMVQFDKVGNIESLQGAQTYYLNVEVPLFERSFDDLLKDARKYLSGRTANEQFNYYDAAKIAYDKAIAHNDCPFELRDTLKAEYKEVLFLRKWIHHHESANDSIAKYTRLKGANSDEVFKWMLADKKILETILAQYPDMVILNGDYNVSKQRIARHPKATVAVKQTQTVAAQRIKGVIVLPDNFTMPMSSISIYASPLSTVKKKDRGSLHLLGHPDAQGRFEVTMPQRMRYLITSAEMTRTADAHYVNPDESFIRIEIE